MNPTDLALTKEQMMQFMGNMRRLMEQQGHVAQASRIEQVMRDLSKDHITASEAYQDANIFDPDKPLYGRVDIKKSTPIQEDEPLLEFIDESRNVVIKDDPDVPTW